MTIEDALDDMKRKDEHLKLEKEKKKVEKLLKQERKGREKLEQTLESYKRHLEYLEADKQHEILKAHLRGMSNFWPKKPQDEIDEAIIKLVTLPNFLEIYKNTLMITKSLDRREYLLMECLTNNVCTMAMNNKQFYSRLRPLGLGLSCPYFEVSARPDMDWDYCLISGRQTAASCGGRHDICKCFQENTGKFATGETNYVAPPNKYKSPELKVSDRERVATERRLIDLNDKYWRDE